MTTEDHSERLRRLESTVADVRVRQTELESLVKATAETTERIASDTSEIIQLMKGASVLGRIARWVGAVVAAYLAGKGLKWW